MLQKNEKTLNLNSIWLYRDFEITPSVNIFLFALFLICDSGSGEKITLLSSHHNKMMMMTLWGEDGETLTSSCPGYDGWRACVGAACTALVMT